MSEYQYCKFLALDRPLEEDEQANVRSLSTRARITGTSFVNEYEWGDFRGSPEQLMEHYYDVHLHFTNWGTRRLMLRLDRDLLSPETVEDYCREEGVTAWVTREHTMLNFSTEDDEGDFGWDPDPLPGLVGIRGELAAGDLRALYLAWLAALTSGEDKPEREVDELQPPVPPGLAALTGPQRALCDFLRVDKDLLHIAAQASPQLEKATIDDTQLSEWLAGLPGTEKAELPAHVFRGKGARGQAELTRRFRAAHPTNHPDLARRPVTALLADAANRKAARNRRARDARAVTMAREEQAQHLARERRLAKLSANEEAAWAQVDEMIASKKPREYDRCVDLLLGLKTIAERDDRSGAFRTRTGSLRVTHARKTSLIARFNRADL